MKEITEVDRCRRCGDRIGNTVMFRIKEGTAYAVGVEYCARIWLCPMCTAKIRARRGDEVAYGVGKHLANDGVAYFVTATLPHDQGDALKTTLGLLAECWRAILTGKAATTDKTRFGILGNIKAVEITHGRHGWHPHIHSVFCLDDELTINELSDWYGRMKGRWDTQLVKRAWRPTNELYGFKIDPVARGSIGDLASYVTKVQDGGGLGNEIARADLKSGRRGSRTPMQILWDYHQTGNVPDLELWLEYERATEGKDALRWSRGLRGLLLAAEEVNLTDEQIAAEEVDGDDVVAMAGHTYDRIIKTPGAYAATLDAIESGSWERLIKTLLAFGADAGGVMTADEWKAAEGVSEL